MDLVLKNIGWMNLVRVRRDREEVWGLNFMLL